MKPDMTAAEHLQQCAACNHGRTPCQEYQRVWPVAEPASTGEPGTGFYRSASLQESIAQDEVERAERPSEPSAPQLHCQECHEVVTFNGSYSQWFHADGTSTYPKCTRPKPAPQASAIIGKGSVELDQMIESAAPQASAEPQPVPCRTPGAVYHSKLARSEQSGREILTLHVYMPHEISIVEEEAQAIEEKLHDACEAILSAYWPDTFAAAPQPVSGPSYMTCTECGMNVCDHIVQRLAGDAPKVEEIARLAKSFVTRWVAERYVQKYPGHVVCEIDILAATELAKDFAVELLRPYFPPASQTPHWVHQEDRNGCVVAAIAMIAGKSYAEVKAELKPKDLSTDAYTSFEAESYFYEHGYSIVKRWKHVCFAGTDREVWPIEPFAPVHYVQVVNGTSGKGHAVVMLANGDVLDPWAGSKPTKLSDYYQVNEIMGVFSPLAAPASTARTDGWVSVADGLPDDDSDVYAAIAWTHSPGVRKYVIHDCSYYEGGTGSGQKIFADCEGEEFEAKDVDFWIYKYRLAEQLPVPQAEPKEGE